MTEKRIDWETQKRFARDFGDEEALRKVEEMEREAKERTNRMRRIFGMEATENEEERHPT